MCQVSNSLEVGSGDVVANSEHARQQAGLDALRDPKIFLSPEQRKELLANLGLDHAPPAGGLPTQQVTPQNFHPTCPTAATTMAKSPTPDVSVTAVLH